MFACAHGKSSEEQASVCTCEIMREAGESSREEATRARGTRRLIAGGREGERRDKAQGVMGER